MGINLKHITVINFLLFLILHHFQHATGFHTYLCIRFPSASFPDSAYSHSGAGDVASVGMEKFPQKIWKKYYYAFDTDEDGNVKDPHFPTKPYINFFLRTLGATGTLFTIDVAPIRGRVDQNPEPVHGWYLLKVRLEKGSGRFDEIVKSFILMVTDEQHNPIGEFMTSAEYNGLKGASCPRNDATKYMVISCGGASKYEPTVSSVVVWASRKLNTFDKQYGEHGPIVPEYKDHILHFYFRYSLQDANRNQIKYFVFRIVAELNENYDWAGRDDINVEKDERTQTLYTGVSWFTVKTGHVPGATDPPLTDVAARDCNLNLIKDKRESPQWFIEKFSNEIFFDYQENQATNNDHWYARVHKYTGCTAKFYGEIPRWHSPTTIKCTGCAGDAHWVCTSEVADEPLKFNNKKTKFLECLDAYNLTMTTSNCVNNLTKDEAENTVIKVYRKPRGNKGNQGNQGNETGIGGSEIGIRDPTELRKRINARGIRGMGFGTLLYSIRKGHGVLMVVVSMFFVPVICFTSRYFKETFMDSRILVMRVWFQIHIQSVFWIIALYIGGMILALSGRALLGASLHIAGFSHRMVGWLTVIFLIIIAISGPFRLLDDPGRKCSIGLHWVLGYLFYILNTISIISSVYIPGSPISDHNESILRDRDEFKISKAYVILGIWIGIEFVLGVVMTIHIHTHDHSMQVERPRKYFPPFIGAAIPVLRENSRHDAAGFTCRHLIFLVYLGLALLAAIGMSGAIITNKMTQYKGYGPMWCSHDEETLSLLPAIRLECRDG